MNALQVLCASLEGLTKYLQQELGGKNLSICSQRMLSAELIHLKRGFGSVLNRFRIIIDRSVSPCCCLGAQFSHASIMNGQQKNLSQPALHLSQQTRMRHRTPNPTESQHEAISLLRS